MGGFTGPSGTSTLVGILICEEEARVEDLKAAI
jgi:hypothetical protein